MKNNLMKRYQLKPVYVLAVQWDGTLQHLKELRQLFLINHDEVIMHSDGSAKGNVNEWKILQSKGSAGTSLIVTTEHYFVNVSGQTVIFTDEEFKSKFDPVED